MISALSSQQAPDYRLYKSEPELTTVKEEVDEANGEDRDKTESSAESKDTAHSKGNLHRSHAVDKYWTGPSAEYLRTLFGIQKNYMPTLLSCNICSQREDFFKL